MTNDKSLSDAQHFERVQIGLARMCVCLGIIGLCYVFEEIFPEQLTTFMTFVVPVLLIIAVIVGLFPLMRAPDSVQKRVNSFSFFPRSLDDITDYISVKAATFSLLSITITLMVVFPILYRMHPELLTTNAYFELAQAVIWLSYGASLMVLHFDNSDE